MPVAEGDIIIVDVPVTTLYFAQQLALRAFTGAEDGIWPDIVSQHRKQQRILTITTEKIEIAHQVEP